jgi:hypothetical protein
LLLANANTFPMIIGDAFVVRFNFPLRVNDKYGTFCKQQSGGIVSGTHGDAYYH